MILDRENIARIKNSLNFKPKGMSISELARQAPDEPEFCCEVS